MFKPLLRTGYQEAIDCGRGGDLPTSVCLPENRGRRDWCLTWHIPQEEAGWCGLGGPSALQAILESSVLVVQGGRPNGMRMRERAGFESAFDPALFALTPFASGELDGECRVFSEHWATNYTVTTNIIIGYDAL
ncbi:hypothetical protein GW17_00041620 [Ensete ventricosum]|nr:hypothetical protein GW17_00041620 [Ensete ventricosum]